MKRLKNYIAGEFIDPVDGKYLSHTHPTSEQVDLEFADSSLLDVVRAIQSANKILPTWLKSASEARSEALMKISEAIELRSNEIAQAVADDQGTPIQASLKISIPSAIASFRYFARVLLEEKNQPGRLPLGLVAMISSWSDPFGTIAPRLAAAIAGGNAIILKPSEHAPRSAQLLAEVVAGAGLPAGVFSLVQGRGDVVGASLVQHPGIGTLSFVGRGETGRGILRDSAEFMKRTQFSLSARNSVLVFAGMDLAQTAKEVAEICASAHPAICMRGSRLFVQESCYKEFIELLKAELESLKIGDPLNPETQVGPLPNKNLFAEFKKAIDLAISEKGKLLTGGTERPEIQSTNGYFVRPTAIYDFTLCSTLQQEEIVGPLMTVASFKYQHDAIKQANNNPFGRAAYVFHPDYEKALKIAAQIEASDVRIGFANGSPAPEISFGNIKNSGLGREGGLEFLNFFSKQTVITRA
jgi:aminomuconate-semialdehyde/2-hydroxymuconate-6-semialdehyde dehydrogenase